MSAQDMVVYATAWKDKSNGIVTERVKRFYRMDDTL